MKAGLNNSPAVPEDLTSHIPVHTPDWGAGQRPDAVKATWLGCAARPCSFSCTALTIVLSHACYLVEFPAPAPGVRGARVLFDPALSHRCSPFSCLGPARITRTCRRARIQSAN